MSWVLRSSGTTGPQKVIEYTKEDMLFIEKQMDYILECSKFEAVEGRQRITFNLFPNSRPNLGFWQVTQLGQYEWIKHFDAGEKPMEEVFELWAEFKPELFIGPPSKVHKFIEAAPAELLSELKIVITGSDRPTKELEELIKSKTGAELIAVYAQTETRTTFMTEYGKMSEGYMINHPLKKLEIIDEEVVVDGFKTGDTGGINKFGKLDLDVMRICDKEKFCGDQ